MTSPVFVKTYPEPAIREEEILRYARCPQPSREVLTLLHTCIEHIREKLRYQVCWREFPVLLDGACCDLGFAVVISQDLAKNLKGCSRVILFAASIGLEIDREIQRSALYSPARALLLQALGAERIEALCDVFEQEIRTEGHKNAQFTRPRFSPGYGDLPLSLQTDIFYALECPQKIGLTLNASLLMSPTKSVTAVIGLGHVE